MENTLLNSNVQNEGKLETTFSKTCLNLLLFNVTQFDLEQNQLREVNRKGQSSHAPLAPVQLWHCHMHALVHIVHNPKLALVNATQFDRQQKVTQGS